MLTGVHPKLPMRDNNTTKQFYLNKLQFDEVSDYGDYLIVEREGVQIHFFEFKTLDPRENYGQIYIRTDDIDELYKSLKVNGVGIHPNGHLQTKPWKQREFSILDPDNNLLTFGQNV